MENELTQHITAQVNLSWNTEQTMAQYKEIIEQSGGEPYDEEMFLEYVASNFLEWLRNSSDKSILREIVILNDQGEVLV